MVKQKGIPPIPVTNRLKTEFPGVVISVPYVLGDLSCGKLFKNRLDKARQPLKDIYSVAKPLVVLVAMTMSPTDLASLNHKEMCPRLEYWWQNNAPSQRFPVQFNRACPQVAFSMYNIDYSLLAGCIDTNSFRVVAYQTQEGGNI